MLPRYTGENRIKGLHMNAQQYKQQLLDELYAPYKNCHQCPLGTLGRTRVVFGEGDPDATLMLIGEGPGADEDAQGRPFVGRSGKLLTKLLNLAGVDRADIFITNIVKCRPPNNRKPTSFESNTCKKLLLLNQIKIIRPVIIATLGSSSLSSLLNKEDIKITQIRGTLLQNVLPGPIKDIPILPTYHPAYILRNPKELNTLYEDLKKAIELAQK